MDEEITDRFISDVYLSDRVIMRRDPDGRVATNVPHLHRHHSPTGYEFGYAGSGPSDLALNLAVVLCQRMDIQSSQTVRLWDKSRCPAVAYAMHQDLKLEFVATTDRAGGEIPWSSLTGWAQSWLDQNRDHLILMGDMARVEPHHYEDVIDG